MGALALILLLFLVLRTEISPNGRVREPVGIYNTRYPHKSLKDKTPDKVHRALEG